jgi:tetratricopeptide (TPR) repeat protein
MNRTTATTTLLIVAITLALIPVSAPAQRLYNKERDEQAQAALPLAQALKTGELFDRQLKNLAALAKKDFDTEFLVTKFNISAATLGLLKWEDAHEQVCQLETLNTDVGMFPTQADLDKALEELKKSIEDAQKALEEFKKSIKKNEEKGDDEEEDKTLLASLFDSLGNLQSLTDFADDLKTKTDSKILAKTVESIKAIQDIVATLKSVYDAYTAKVEEFNKLSDQLADMRIVLKKVAIQSLQVDEEHWKNIASIRARRELDRANVLSLINEYKAITRRLRSPNLDQSPEALRGFCTAFRRATNKEDGLELWPYQLITDHMTEIVTRAEAMETDNGAIESEARNAIATMRNASSETQRRAAAAATFTALTNAINHIDAREPVHNFEPENRRDMDAKRKELVNAVASSTARSVTALTEIAIMAREKSIRNRDMVGDIPQALFILSTLIARGSTPNRLADVRLAQELHAYSIRKSAVRARAYELTVSTGAQRLALFHKGGIKPTDIAELVFAASNVAITPAILAR